MGGLWRSFLPASSTLSFFLWWKMDPMLDADKVAKSLYIGSYPADYEKGGLKKHGFDALVLSAIEDQAPGKFQDLDVYRVPLRDDSVFGLTDQEWADARKAAGWASDHLKRGDRVLITCHMGINRSALITALTIKLTYPEIPAKDIVAHIQYFRKPSFLNQAFKAQFLKWAESRKS